MCLIYPLYINNTFNSHGFFPNETHTRKGLFIQCNLCRVSEIKYKRSTVVYIFTYILKLKRNLTLGFL